MVRDINERIKGEQGKVSLYRIDWLNGYDFWQVSLKIETKQNIKADCSDRSGVRIFKVRPQDLSRWID